MSPKNRGEKPEAKEKSKVRRKKLDAKEKSKVKLKAKILLPKGQNVTDVSFKVETVVTQKQLKDANEAETRARRKLYLTEMLPLLGHRDVNSRLEGLNGLRELVTFHPPEAFLTHLDQILEGLTALILGREMTVRRESLKLLKVILLQVTSDHIVPFFGILLSCLSRAMTHIHTRTREDSLLLLDILFERTPSLIAEYSPKIFRKFAEMISYLHVESHFGCTPTEGLGSEITRVKQRNKVLTRLRRLLQALVDSKSAKDEEDHDSWNRRSSYVWKIDLTNVFGREGVEMTSAELLKCMNVLMSLLFETWLDVSPASVNKGKDLPESLLSVESAELLGCILDIAQLSWEYVEWWERDTCRDSVSPFKSPYDWRMRKYFLPGLPFSRVAEGANFAKRREDGTRVRGATLCTRQNLVLCHLLCSLNDATKREVCARVLDCITKCIKSCDKVDAASAAQLDKVVRFILVKRSKDWVFRQIDLEPLLDALVERSSKVGSHLKNDAAEVLMDVSLDLSLLHLHGYASLMAWQAKLVRLLCEPKVSEKAVNVMTRLGCQNQQQFLDYLAKKMPKILRNLPKLVVTGAKSPKRARENVGMLVYWVAERPGVNELLLKESHYWEKPLKKYIRELAASKIKKVNG